jgi:D-alanyl-D-alanine carboxypeptidase/D-alanyl-D-alanine-endopeptidase (penicillin-binding protein 4)
VVYEAPSLPLAEVVTDINKFSNNLMAQQVFLTLGRLDAGLIDQREGQMQPAALASAPPATFERSRALLARWWQNRLGGQASAPLLENGAGLSRQERISAQALLALLRLAAHHPQGAVLAQSLPVAGVDGTAAHMGQRGVIQAALGNARIKTGSLRDVVAVAGYVQSRSGRPLVVVVGIVNHVNAPQARPALDALLEWAATSGLAYAPAPAATR